MAFYLEERDAKFLTDNQTPNIGPGQYEKGIFTIAKNTSYSGERKFVTLKRPAFS
jgi:hypothetical protein